LYQNKATEAMQWLQTNASPTWLVNVSTLNIDYAGYTERLKFASQTFEYY
jgi:hypothetical protein